MQNIRRPDILYSEIVEIDCRIIPTLENKCELNQNNWRIVKGSTGEEFYITKEQNQNEVREKLLQIKQTGIDSISVALAHSYAFPDHELQIGQIATELGSNTQHLPLNLLNFLFKFQAFRTFHSPTR